MTEADLVDTFNGKGPFTVFAPNNDAFKKMRLGKTRDDLKEMLLSHIDPEMLTKEPTSYCKTGIPYGTTILTRSKPSKYDMKVTREASAKRSEDKVMIETKKVLTADIFGSNGVIHIVD